jgi:hypothetical protein
LNRFSEQFFGYPGRAILLYGVICIISHHTRRVAVPGLLGCDAPSIWVEPQPETKTVKNNIEQADTALDEQFLPARTDPRIKSRLVTCIRHRGHDEEAVCENLSEGGVSFRSRTQYAEGSQVEIAVPFRPGITAVFVPGRIVFSLPVRSAGLFRHGVAYIKNLPEA